ncbi:MAG TPA: YopX family protein [Agriterribacter sp.]|nr:YopX family protein [Agriterribacter sp.]
MRQIKFRCWNKSRKKMYYPADQYAPAFELAFSEGFWGVNAWSQGGEWLDKVAHSEDGDSLMQFTGLTDKNGKEIYEGDLVKANWLVELGITELDCTGIGIVEWDENNPCFYLHLIKPYKSGIQQDMTYEETDLPIFNDGYDERYSFEIIGNIYETPELLSKQ